MQPDSFFADWISFLLPLCLLAIPAVALLLFFIAWMTYLYQRLREKKSAGYKSFSAVRESVLTFRRTLVVAVVLIIGYSIAAVPISIWQQRRIQKVLTGCTKIRIVCCSENGDPADPANHRYLETDPVTIQNITHKMAFMPSPESFGGNCGCVTSYELEFQRDGHLMARMSVLSHAIMTTSIPFQRARFTRAYSELFMQWLQQRCPLPRR